MISLVLFFFFFIVFLLFLVFSVFFLPFLVFTLLPNRATSRDIFDQFYNDADNAQLAKNILTFLTENCATGGGCNGNCPGGQGICFADYCYCNSSFTGDSCEKGNKPKI